MSRETELRERQKFEAQLIEKAWADPAFRAKLIADPKGAIAAELASVDPGATLAADLTIHVVSESPTEMYLVLPLDPEVVEPDVLEDVSAGGCNGKTVTCSGKCGIRLGCNNKTCSTECTGKDISVPICTSDFGSPKSPSGITGI